MRRFTTPRRSAPLPNQPDDPLDAAASPPEMLPPAKPTAGPPSLPRQHPDDPKVKLLRGLPWDSNSCWLDVGVELLHTCLVYGARLPEEPISKTKTRLWLHQQVLQLRSIPNTGEVIDRKNALWAEAHRMQSDIPSVGTFHALDVNILSLAKFNRDTVEGSFVTECPQCGFQAAKSRVAYFTFPGSDYPETWTLDVACPACGIGGRERSVTVQRAPTFITVAGERLPKTATGKIPSLLRKFGEEYVLVFAPVNEARCHFTAHVRLGNHWYYYDPGPGRRMLVAKAYGNPPLPTSPAGECVFVLRSVFDETATRWDPLLTADPPAGPLEEPPPSALYKPSRLRSNNPGDDLVPDSDGDDSSPSPPPSPPPPPQPSPPTPPPCAPQVTPPARQNPIPRTTRAAESSSDDDILTWTPPSRTAGMTPINPSYLDREISKEEVHRILGLSQTRKRKRQATTTKKPSRRVATGTPTTPAAHTGAQTTTRSKQATLRKNFSVERYAKEKNASLPDDFHDEHTALVEAKQAALAKYKNTGKQSFLL